MPLYEYQCSACGHQFEKIQKFSDPPVHECPKCGQEARRMVSSPAFQFKGSGWYITDYARAGKASGDSGESSSPAEKSTSKASEKPSDTSSSKTSGTDAAKETKPAPAKTD